MNPVTFNDSIAKYGHFGPIKDWPLFYIRGVGPSDHNQRDIDAFCDNIRVGRDSLPFNQFRLFIDAPTDGLDQVKISYKALVQKCNEPESNILVTFQPLLPIESDHVIANVWLSDKPGYLKDAWLRNGKQAKPNENGRAMADRVIATLAVLCSQIDGGHFISEVRPDKQGKSVEWTKARTHFVLLHKSHPANNAMLKAGVGVTEDAGYIKRQAHSRRAHFRILRSPKFRHKIGQRIRVKACWCGPKEWKQGSSIYILRDDLTKAA